MWKNRRKKRKGREKDEENEKDEKKKFNSSRWARDLKFGSYLRCGWQWMKISKKEEERRKGREKDEENEKDENEKLNLLPDHLETWNLDHSSEMDENEWKYKKRRKKTKGGRDKYENVSTNHSFTCICAGSYVANSNVMYV